MALARLLRPLSAATIKRVFGSAFVHTLRGNDGWIEDLRNTRMAHQHHEKPHLFVDVTWTKHGRPFHLRPLTLADRDLVGECFKRLSEESKMTRCFGVKQELSPEELIYYTDCDMKNHFGVGVLTVPWDEEELGKKDKEEGWVEHKTTDGGDGAHGHEHHGFKPEDFTVGVATGRWVRLKTDPARAEVAFTVMDEFQGWGVGRKVFEKLIEGARFNRLKSLEAIVLPENPAARNLITHHSHIEKAVRTPDGIVLVFSVPLVYEDEPHVVQDTMCTEALSEHGLRATLMHGDPSSLHLRQRLGIHYRE